VHVNWSRSEVEAVLSAVRAAPDGRGKKSALSQLEGAERRLAEKVNPKAHVSLYFGEKPLALLGSLLAKDRDPRRKKALETLQRAALQTRRSAGKAAATKTNLHNPLADTRDQRVRHVTGRPRPAR
jgi:hypothetical protein